ncbi:MAG: hypothetical protein WCB73_23185, partial [Pseudonocardiaceae bacterium]
MANVPDGTYRISLYRQQFLTAEGGRVVLFPYGIGLQVWQIRRTDKGGYTIRQPDADGCLSYEGEPDVFEPVRLLPDEREWNITDGPDADTVTIATPGSDPPLTLGLSPILIFPPMVALSPPQLQD